MNRRKSDLAILQGLIIGLTVIGVVIVIGLLIVAQMKTQVIEDIPTNATYYERVDWTNNTYTPLINNSGKVGIICVGVANSSEAEELIDPGNYTCSINGIKLVDRSDDGIDTWNTTGVLVNYTWKEETYAYNASGTVQNATQDIPGWLGIIVVTVIGALLISLIVKLFRPGS